MVLANSEYPDCLPEKNLPEVNAAKLYDDLIYRVALRTSNELLEADDIFAAGRQAPQRMRAQGAQPNDGELGIKHRHMEDLSF